MFSTPSTGTGNYVWTEDGASLGFEGIGEYIVDPNQYRWVIGSSLSDGSRLGTFYVIISWPYLYFVEISIPFIVLFSVSFLFVVHFFCLKLFYTNHRREWKSYLGRSEAKRRVYEIWRPNLFTGFR